jgi:probable phosphomutase (TIGR03848 family)
MATTILLVRHGQNDWVKKNRLAGWIPGVHLNDTGRQQADAAATRLAHLPVKAVYTSPLERCRETAAAIAVPHQLPLIELPAVGEVGYGQWEGAKIKKLAKDPRWTAVQHYPGRFRFPEGESLFEVQARGVAALEELARQHPDELIVVVSHADLIKLLLAHYLGVHIDLFQRVVVSPASVTVLALHPEGIMRVVRLNDDGPLQPPSTEERPSAVQKKKDKQKKAKKKRAKKAKEQRQAAAAEPEKANE